MLITSEMKDLKGTCGSYDLVVLSNIVTLPLSKHLMANKKPDFDEKSGWDLYAVHLLSNSEISQRWPFDESLHDAEAKQQLSRHVKRTTEYIDLFSPTTILQISQPILTVLRGSANDAHVLMFARQLDYHLRTTFFNGKWSLTSLQVALNSIKSDRALYFYRGSLSKNIKRSENYIKSLCDVLYAFVRKFSKRRCVLYLAKDGFAPMHEDDESAIRKMLNKLRQKEGNYCSKPGPCTPASDVKNKVNGPQNVHRDMSLNCLQRKHVIHVVSWVTLSLPAPKRANH